MKKALLLFALLAVSRAAFAAPAQWSGNGHWYEVILVPGGISWPNAALVNGTESYLATITSADENQFVLGLLTADPSAWWDDGFNNRYSPWLGGRRTVNDPDPAVGWSWVSGEAWSYTSWQTGEPNDFFGDFTENSLNYYAPIGTLLTSAGWNDFRGTLLMNGYVLETVPEPSSAAALLTGVTGLIGLSIRKRSK